MTRPPFKPRAVNPWVPPFDPTRKVPTGAEAGAAAKTYTERVIRTTTAEDMARIVQITERMGECFEKYKLPTISTMSMGLDVAMVHSRTPLNLWRLLACGDDDFTHDVIGIATHVDRDTGYLRDGWKPRNLA